MEINKGSITPKYYQCRSEQIEHANIQLINYTSAKGTRICSTVFKQYEDEYIIYICQKK